MRNQRQSAFDVNILQHRTTIKPLLMEHIQSRNTEEADDAFFLADLGEIIQRVNLWKKVLPRVEPFYAVKCNDNPTVLRLLAGLGLSFDCASKHEISCILKLGVSPSRIIYAHPCKQTSFVRYAAKHRVSKMTFDNAAELYKIKTNYPRARLVLRIMPPTGFKVQCDLSKKFGCLPKNARHLLKLAAELQLNVIGVSFHVGSGCEEADAYRVAIEQASYVFATARELGFKMHLLDIGGGYPGPNSAPISIRQIATVVNKALDLYFPVESRVRIIAEPGQYMVASSFTLAVNVIGKQMITRDLSVGLNDETDESHPNANDEPAFKYYVNDGVYGSFRIFFMDKEAVYAKVLKQDCEALKEHDDEEEDLVQNTSSIWGPTYGAIDCINRHCSLPELRVGDWLYFEDMGAYTMCAASQFTGIPKPKCSFFVDADVWRSAFPDRMQRIEEC